jgi:succinate dehydrogenase / fumarate reductase cytochrome b subunit
VESHAAVAVAPAGSSVFARNSFLIKRVFSLMGLFFGGYVVVHLLTNASLLASVGMFQTNVDRIHSLGPALPVVEWTFLFIPILFHALIGWAIIAGASPNLGSYRYVGNVRYMLQRVTAIILFFFIVGHLWHLHYLGAPFGGGKFDPDHASSSLAKAFQPALPFQLFYVLGILSAAFHLGNGIWTAGITWGLWTTPAAQQRANKLAIAVGVLIFVLGIASLMGVRRVNIEQAVQVEDRMERARQMLSGADVAVDETNASTSDSESN